MSDRFAINLPINSVLLLYLAVLQFKLTDEEESQMSEM